MSNASREETTPRPPVRGTRRWWPVGRGRNARREVAELSSVGEASGRASTPDRASVVFVVLLGIVSTILSVVGPKLLGTATNVIVAGSVGKNSLRAPPRPRFSRSSAVAVTGRRPTS